ncbi:GNAT family N-acetyltransferase [Paenibacillus sp. M1]|uniref:GNAT family N-acetyltransferase n=1 Tax=Paenibacillus haidiansis TaxID=1574488 RepID=A0ABU7VKF0_9BACL
MTAQINYSDVEKLQKICEFYDGIALKLNWDMLYSATAGLSPGLTEYRDGKLAAFLGKYEFGSTLEICGMVHPDYRRQGIFSSLLQQALDESTLSRFSVILLNTPENSVSGQAFMKSVPCAFAHSEIQMKYDSCLDQSLPVRQDIKLRRAESGDKPLLAKLDHEGFDIPLIEALEVYDTDIGLELPEYELLLLDEEPIGKLRVSRRDNEAWIYGFAVAAARRGQGVGSAALRKVIDREHKDGYDIWLEVAVNNPNAKKLYESVGFRAIRAQDYYEYSPV